MLKRARTNDDAPAVNETAESRDVDGDRRQGELESGEWKSVSSLAGWCDDQLQEAAGYYTSDHACTTVMESPLSAFRPLMQEYYRVFVENLRDQHGIVVTEEGEGASVLETWHGCAADAARIVHMREHLATDSRFQGSFAKKKQAANALLSISDRCVDAFDAWNFDIGWELAKVVVANSSEGASSEDENSDEPVEESESDEVSDEVSEDDDSGSEEDDSGSEEDEEEKEEE